MARLLTALTALTAGAVCALLVVSPALGKGDVRAKLDSPLRLETPAGQAITIGWTLSYPDRGTRRPFGAGGVYVQLLSGSGGAPVKALGKERSRGSYVARVRVPDGGIGGIRVGLEGIRYINGRGENADMYFPIENDPFAAAAADRSGEGGSFPIGFLAAALAALGVVVAGLRVLSSRRLNQRSLAP